MSAGGTPVGTSLGTLRRPQSVDGRPWRRDLVLRLALVVGCCGIAYGAALLRLAGRLGTQSPTAFAVLVPVVALVAAAALVGQRPDPAELLPNGAADATVAVGLVALSAVATWWLPAAFGFDTARLGLDLVGLPMFAAGVATLIIGGRAVYLARSALAFAVLASPPVLSVFGGWFERVGIAVGWPVVRWVAGLLGAAVTSSDGVRMVDLSGTLVAVDLACAGASTALGVVVVAAGVTPVLGGQRRRRWAWLGVAAFLALLGNAVRLAAIVVVGDALGGPAALDLVHPWAGMVVAAVTAGVALGLLPRFGLTLPSRGASPGRRLASIAPRLRPWRLAAAGVATVVIGLGTGAAWETDPLAGVGGDPNRDALAALEALATDPATATLDDRVVELTPVPWADQFFGPGATWERRLVFVPDDTTVSVDVVTARADGPFDAYGLVACYATHGEVLEQVSGDVGLPGRAGVWLRYATDGRDAQTRLLSWRSRLDDGSVQRVVVAALADSDDADAVLAADGAVLDVGTMLAAATPQHSAPARSTGPGSAGAPSAVLGMLVESVR